MNYYRIQSCSSLTTKVIKIEATLNESQIYIFKEFSGCWSVLEKLEETAGLIPLSTVLSSWDDCTPCRETLPERIYNVQDCDTEEVYVFRVPNALIINNVYKFNGQGDGCFKVISISTRLDNIDTYPTASYGSCKECSGGIDPKLVIIEDDINLKFSREMTENETLFSIENEVVITNGTTEHTLYSYTIPLTQNYVGGYLDINEELLMDWAGFFSLYAVNNKATVVTTANNIAVKLPNLINWRYFQSMPSLITIFGVNATNDWLWFQNNGWGIKVNVKTFNGIGNYLEEAPLVIRDYDDNVSINWTWEILRKSDLTPLTTPIAGEESIIKVIGDMPSNTTDDIDYSSVTVEGYEGNDRWVISTYYPQAGQTNSPLKQLAGQLSLKQTNVTSPNRRVELEFVFDPTKINASKVRFTARAYKIGAQTYTERTEKEFILPTLPRPQLMPEFEGDGCCDCPPEPKLASSTSEDLMQNDITGLSHKNQSLGDTCTFKIYKGNDLLPNAGIDYNNGFPFDSDVSAFVYNWKYYLLNYGEGCYRIEKDYTVAGVVFNEVINNYKLEEFTPENAKGTVRVLYQNNFETLWDDSTINYADSGFEDSYRFRGMLHDWQPNVFSDSNFSEFNENRVSSIKSKDTYKLSLFNANECHVQRLHKIVMHAALWRVSDHNPSNALQENKIYECILDKENTEQITYFNGSKKAGVEVILSKRQQNSVSLFNGSIQLVKGITWQLPIVAGSGTGGGTAIVTNSNATYNNTVDGGDTLVLADVNNVDSDGAIVPTPAMIPFVCTLALKDLFLYLTFLGTDDSIDVLGDLNNAGTYTTIPSGLTYSTDGLTYTSIPNPFTMVSSQQYYFRRAIAIVTETKTFQGTYA